MTLAESHFHAAKTIRKAFDKKSCTLGPMVSSPAECLKKLDKTYFKAIKMPKNNATEA
jgi:hypothetical protein